MKKCSKCSKEKKLEEFSLRGRGKYQTFCKECSNKYVRERYNSEKENLRKKKQKEANPERYAEIDRKAHVRYRKKHKAILLLRGREQYKFRKKQPYNKEKSVKAVIKWRNANREKVNCAYKAQYARKTGKLIEPKRCAICRCEDRLEMHHTDYSKPLEIIWCCRSCHVKLDRIRREAEQN